MTAAIRADALSKSFTSRRGRPTVHAVDGISFEVGRGERVAYIGPNGAGKSTSIKMLTGVLHPTSGSASVLGLVPWQHRRALTCQIGTLFGQRSQLWFELTPRETFRVLGAIYRLEDLPRRVDELGELLEAAELFDQPVRSLSLGQRMRCELAACLLHEPDVLFLDEPTIGLDLVAKQRFRDLLVELNTERRTTIFLTSHDVADIEHVAERAIVINHGQVIYDAQVATMRRELLSRKIVEVALAVPVDLPHLHGVTVAEQTPSLLRVVVDTSVRPVREVLDAVLLATDATDLTVTDPPLEEVIAEIYARPLP